MAIQESSSTARLRTLVSGSVVLPDESEYDQARSIWNGAVDKRPAAVVRAASVADVVAVVNFARETGMELAVRGGGHSLPGFSSSQDGLVLDLGGMHSVTVDPEARTATVEGGATWAQFDAATHEHGLACTGGLISSTGVGGLTLGGGIGWLVRLCGLSCDSLIGAEVVSADGRVVHAGSGENADLLWGLRGGGGNFGVVTKFEFRLQPVSTVLTSLLMWPEERAAEVLRVYRDWVGGLPDEITTLLAITCAPPADFVPVELRGSRVVGVIGCNTGDPELGEALLQPLLELEPPIRMIAPLPYPVLQSMLDAGAPPGLHSHLKGGYLDSLSDSAIAVVVDQAQQRPGDLCELHLHHMGGAFARVGENETAFGNRAAHYAYNIIAICEDPADLEGHRDWARATSRALAPVSSQGTYVNFLTDSSPELVREAYGSRYDRLVELKRRYDPGNLFRLNQNIRP